MYLYLNIFCYENNYNCQSICFFAVKINIDWIKSFPILSTFYFINSKNFNTEFPTLMRFCLQQGLYKIEFLHPWKSHAQNGRSDSTPRILTSWIGQSLPTGRGRSCGPTKKVRAHYMFSRILNFLFVIDFLRKSCLFDKK